MTCKLLISISVRRLPTTAGLLLAATLIYGVSAGRAHSQTTFKVLHAFTGVPDGATPYAPLLRGPSGELYGTTYYGGSLLNSGTVFKLDTAGNETVLQNLGGADGQYPYAGLIPDKTGNLYGVTQNGGGPGGRGTLFKLDPSGALTVIHTFVGGQGDGASPMGTLHRDAAGNLYGTTQNGGKSGLGTVFKVDTTGAETVLYSFKGSPDGWLPTAGLVEDAGGNLYGTAGGGAVTNAGVVFKIDPHGNESLLHTFNGTDGLHPNGNLIRDSAGNLYGTTISGGTYGYGTVFKIDPLGKFSVVHSFNGSEGSAIEGGLTEDSAGNFYGTANIGAFGLGTVFKMDKTGKVTVLYAFTGNGDSGYPVAGVVRDTAGNLYGTASGGNPHKGTVFELTFP